MNRRVEALEGLKGDDRPTYLIGSFDYCFGVMEPNRDPGVEHCYMTRPPTLEERAEYLIRHEAQHAEAE